MLAALALTLFPAGASAAQDTVAVASLLDGFQELAVEYAQAGAILRTWMEDEPGELRSAFRVLDMRAEPGGEFEPDLLHRWPVAWTFYFEGGVVQDAWLAGQNQLHHPEQGRLTLDASFVAQLQSRLAEQAGGAVALRMENPLPTERQEQAKGAAEALGKAWTEVRLEVRGAAPVLWSLEGSRAAPRLVLAGANAPLPDGGAKIVLRGTDGELVLRLLQASRSATLVYDHTWVYLDGTGPVWIPNDWMRPLFPAMPSLQPVPSEAGLTAARAVLESPSRLARELELLALETRPLDGEYGPPNYGQRDAPVARMPTRVWALLEYEPMDWDQATWRRRIADLERRGAARMLVRGEGDSGPWEFGLVPTAPDRAYVPFLGAVQFSAEAWTDAKKVVAPSMGIKDSEALRLVPR